jgi:hypothetical protein
MKTIVFVLFFLAVIISSASAAFMDIAQYSVKAENIYLVRAPMPASVERDYASSVSEEQEQDEEGDNEDSDYCAKSRRQCYNSNPDRRLCEAKYEECLGTPAPAARVDSE